VIVGIAIAALRSPTAALRLGNAAARFAAWVKGLFHRPPPTWGGESLVRFREERLVLLRRRWAVLTAATLANQLTAYITFVFSLRAVGISSATIPLSEAFLAWAIGRVISSLPLTPGGIGVVELGMIGTLVGFGASNAHVVAAVLLYRGLVVLPSLIVGAVGLPALRFLAPEPEPS
jgi:putative heme transporter